MRGGPLARSLHQIALIVGVGTIVRGCYILVFKDCSYG